MATALNYSICDVVQSLGFPALLPLAIGPLYCILNRWDVALKTQDHEIGPLPCDCCDPQPLFGWYMHTNQKATNIFLHSHKRVWWRNPLQCPDLELVPVSVRTEQCPDHCQLVPVLSSKNVSQNQCPEHHLAPVFVKSNKCPACQHQYPCHQVPF